jgi:hypothetical protein
MAWSRIEVQFVPLSGCNPAEYRCQRQACRVAGSDPVRDDRAGIFDRFYESRGAREAGKGGASRQPAGHNRPAKLVPSDRGVDGTRRNLALVCRPAEVGEQDAIGGFSKRHRYDTNSGGGEVGSRSIDSERVTEYGDVRRQQLRLPRGTDTGDDDLPGVSLDRLIVQR